VAAALACGLRVQAVDTAHAGPLAVTCNERT
jgi:hypothetical protein